MKEQLCSAFNSDRKDAGNLLIIFSRYPVPGEVKTRLIPLLGPSGAARLQRDMCIHIIRNVCQLNDEAVIEIHFEGSDEAAMKKMFGSDFAMHRQSEGDIGERMLQAFRKSFERGFENVVIIGSDCPFITPSIIRKAFDMLGNNDCVLGPAFDGGYYLIGLKKPFAGLFEAIDWSSKFVLEQTMSKTRSIGLSAILLDRLHDIDRPEDVRLWEDLSVKIQTKISVVIPAFDEEESISDTLKSLKSAEDIEVIVADGGSRDRTATIAQNSGARLIRTEKGRALQMNKGAACAEGDILLFLHADTRLYPGFERDIRKSLADARNIAGSFSLSFGSDRFSLKLIELGANLRSRIFELPYGDQGIFMKSSDFKAAGGFTEMPVMEDVDLVRRLRKKGRIIVLPGKAVSSARRFSRLGVMNAFLINQLVFISFKSGAEPERIAGLYRTDAGLAGWFAIILEALINKCRNVMRMLL